MNNINERYVNLNKRIKKSTKVTSILSVLYYVFLALSLGFTFSFGLLTPYTKTISNIINPIGYTCYTLTILFMILLFVFEKKRRVNNIENIILFNHILLDDEEILYSLAKKHSLNFNNIVNNLNINDIVNFDKETTEYILKELNENKDKTIYLKFANFEGDEKLRDLIKNHPKISQGYQIEDDVLTFIVNKSYIPIIEVIDCLEFKKLNVFTNSKQLKIIIDYHSRIKNISIDCELIK